MSGNVDRLGAYIGEMMAENERIKKQKGLYACQVTNDGGIVKASDGKKYSSYVVNDMNIKKGDVVYGGLINNKMAVIGKW